MTERKEAVRADDPKKRDWLDVSTLPQIPGSRVIALVETEIALDEYIPALLIGGWRRVGSHDRIVGWRPSGEGKQEVDGE